MTDDEVQALLKRGNAERAASRATFEEAYAGSSSEVAKCWASHMLAIVIDIPEEKLRWNLESLRAAEAAGDDPRAPGLYPTVLANLGYSELLMARPDEARHRYEQALAALEDSGLAEDGQASYRVGIEHMLGVIDRSTH